MIKTKAIVISQKAVSDHDSLVSFYTLEFGRVSFLAKGLKRPSSKLAGHLDLLNLVDLMIIKGREKDYVGSAISENCFLQIKESYDKTIIAGYGLNFLNKLSFNNQADYEVFLLLREFLFSLNEMPDEIEALQLILSSFKLRLLDLLGYNFDFSSCFVCHGREAVALNYYKKELYCADCLKKVSPDDFRNNFIRINPGTLKLKIDLQTISWSELRGYKYHRNSHKELEKLIDIIIKII